MAIRTITSDPKPSPRHVGYYYAYYDKTTDAGRACAVSIVASAAPYVKVGYQFDDETNVHWNDALRTSVLSVDFDDQPPMEEPSLPPDPESGWGDPDGVPATPLQPAQVPVFAGAGASGNGHALPGLNGHGAAAASGHRPMRAPAYRRDQAQQLADLGAQLPAAYLKINHQVARSFLVQLALIGNAVGEQHKANIAQKLCAIASIPYFRQVGINLNEEDIKGMTMI